MASIAAASAVLCVQAFVCQLIWRLVRIFEGARTRLRADRRRRCALALSEPLGRVVDHHVLGQAGGPLGGRDLEDSVQVEVEPDQDLVAGRDFGQPLDVELADQGIVAGVLVLALEDADFGGRLVVLNGRVDLGAAGGQRRVPLDDGREACSDMNPCSSPRALIPSVWGVMSTRIGPTSMPAISPP